MRLHWDIGLNTACGYSEEMTDILQYISLNIASKNTSILKIYFLKFLFLVLTLQCRARNHTIIYHK